MIYTSLHVATFQGEVPPTKAQTNLQQGSRFWIGLRYEGVVFNGVNKGFDDKSIMIATNRGRGAEIHGHLKAEHIFFSVVLEPIFCLGRFIVEVSSLQTIRHIR